MVICDKLNVHNVRFVSMLFARFLESDQGHGVSDKKGAKKKETKDIVEVVVVGGYHAVMIECGIAA